jgi:hypothetical protein
MARLLRSTTTSKLRPPVVVAPAAPAFVASKLLVELAAVPRRHSVYSTLGAPVVIAASITVSPVETRLARSVRQARVVRSELRPPVVTAVTVTFIAPPPRVRLAYQPRQPRTVTSTINAPAIVDSAPPFGLLETRLAPQPRQARATHSRLRPPTVVTPISTLPPFAPVQVNYRAAVARAVQHRGYTSSLLPPTMVDPFVPPPPPEPEPPRWSPFVDHREDRWGEYDPSRTDPKLTPR